MAGISEILRDVERGAGVSIIRIESLSGGSISDAKLLISSIGTKLFLKSKPGSAKDFFAVEAFNLKQLRDSETVDVPEVILESSTLSDREGKEPFIVIEYIEPGECSGADQFALGVSLARLHSRPMEQFGFVVDNFIGSMPQSNTRAVNCNSMGA